jgi:hypothetical protein
MGTRRRLREPACEIQHTNYNRETQKLKSHINSTRRLHVSLVKLIQCRSPLLELPSTYGTPAATRPPSPSCSAITAYLTP